jgi:hypothetical protein
MDYVKATPRQPMVDCLRIDAGSEELRPRHDAVLLVREVSDYRVNPSALSLPGYATTK